MQHSTFFHKFPGHFRTVLAVALLLAGIVFAAHPAGRAMAAAACTSAADGDWSSPATWDCGAPGLVPGPADDVSILHEVAFTASQSVHNLTINPEGVLRNDSTPNQPATLTINGDFDVQGVFDDHVGGTVVFGSGSQAIHPHGDWVDFSNLTKVSGGSGDTLSVDPAACCGGGIHILNTLTLKGAAGNPLLLRSTTPGAQWQIWPEGALDVDYVDVQDGLNANTDLPITVLHGSDSGDNTGWALTSTTLTLTSSGSPSVFGEPVTFTAALAPGAATGAVTFKDGANVIPGCEAQVVTDGSADCTTSALSRASHTISAEYSGDGAYLGSASNKVTQVVDQFSAITLSSSANPSEYGRPVTFTAMAMPAPAASTVTFKADGAPISDCTDLPLMNGMATCATGDLLLGQRDITAVYGASASYNDGSSTPLEQVVKYGSAVAVNSAKTPSIVFQQVTFTAVVTPAVVDPAVALDGTVTFKDAGEDIPGCANLALVDGSAQCQISDLIARTHTISAFYSGNTSYLGSASPEITQVIGWLKFYLSILRR